MEEEALQYNFDFDCYNDEDYDDDDDGGDDVVHLDGEMMELEANNDVFVAKLDQNVYK